MSYFRGAEYNAVKQPRGGRRARKSKGQNDPKTTTALLLAEKYGVSEKTIKREPSSPRPSTGSLADYGDPEVKRRLLGADVKLTQGTARVLYRMSPADRKKAVDQA